jgi:hypothetical protein
VAPLVRKSLKISGLLAFSYVASGALLKVFRDFIPDMFLVIDLVFWNGSVKSPGIASSELIIQRLLLLFILMWLLFFAITYVVTRVVYKTTTDQV